MGAQDEILKLNQELLDSIASGNFSKYNSLCASDLTCFEPETAGVLVQGISFHKYYFDLDQAMAKETETESASASTLPITNISMSNPHLRWLGDDAVIIAYTRLDQKLDAATPVTKKTSETRVWEKRDGEWKHVHFHKS